MLLFCAAVWAATLSVQADADEVAAQIGLEEGWKLNAELASEILVQIEPGGSRVVDRLEWTVPSAFFENDTPPERLRIEALLQVCRDDLCKQLALDGTAEVASSEPVELAVHPDPAGLATRLKERQERLAAALAEMKRRATVEDPRYAEMLRADARKTLKKTLKTARRKKQLALLIFGGDGCAPCGALAKEALLVDDDPARLDGRVTWALLNMLDPGLEEQLAAWELEIALPTIVLVERDGTLRARTGGYSSLDSFSGWLDENL